MKLTKRGKIIVPISQHIDAKEVLFLHIVEGARFILAGPPEAYQATGEKCYECGEPVMSSAEFWDRRIGHTRCGCTMKLARFTQEHFSAIDAESMRFAETGRTLPECEEEMEAAVDRLTGQTEVITWAESVALIKEKQALHRREFGGELGFPMLCKLSFTASVERLLALDVEAPLVGLAKLDLCGTIPKAALKAKWFCRSDSALTTTVAKANHGGPVFRIV